MVDVKEPTTYGEYYWAAQVDAQTVFEETVEESLKPFIPSLFTDPEIRASIPFDVLGKLEGLLDFPHPGLAGVGGRFVSEVADQAVSMVMTPALRKTQYASNRLFKNLILSPDAATALFRRKRLLKDAFDYRMSAAGFDEFEQKFAYDGSAPFPTLPELFRWARYHGDPTNVWATLFDYVDLDPLDFPKWNWLTQQQLTTDQLTGLYKREKIAPELIAGRLQQVGWSISDAANITDLSYVIPNAMLLMQGDLHVEASIETIFEDLGHADIHPDYRRKYYDAVLTKPSSSDLVAYHLRQENELADLPDDLKKTGIHPDYLHIYETLAERIPPVADIITMAVREAFTPETARRFGQYEDFPRDFARYAAQQGLSEEWAERYWAAHWGLPSVTQGFDMLHRGIINESDLTMLLKAQDVMPFWREKLIDMAYRPLTRVDVRRMYKEGVLDEGEVYESYLTLGYNEENARRMADFTVKQALSTMAKFSSTDVVKAYTQRMIDRSEANSLLRNLGIRHEDVSYILSTAEYKRAWAFMDDQTAAIRNLYRKGQYDDNKSRAELLRLGFPSEQVEALMSAWYFEKKADGIQTFTKAETFKFFKQGLIDQPTVENELRLMGYDDEHVTIYVRALLWQEPAA